VSRKSVPKQKREKAANKPSKASTTRKRSKAASTRALGARLASADDSEGVRIASPRLVGYARVSTDEQTTRLQLDALKAAGCERIFEDKESGALRSRPRLDRALAELNAGDTLVVWKLDRLGRSLRDLLDVAESLRERGVALRSLTEHIDTATAAGKMLYAVLGAVAQFERDVLRERTVAGMRAAKSRGEHIGRPAALKPSQVGGPLDARARGEPIARRSRAARRSLNALSRDHPNLIARWHLRTQFRDRIKRRVKPRR